MLQVQERKAAGLIAGPNPIAAAEGACVSLVNCVIDRDDVVNPRRGYTRWAPGSASVMGEYKGKVIALVGTELRAYSADGSYTAFSGSFSSPDTFSRTRFLRDKKNLYFTASRGLYKLDRIAGIPRLAGMPPALDLTLELATGTWMAADRSCAYRVTWGRRDANKQLILGAPSSRRLLPNPKGGTAQAISITTTIPDEILVGDILSIWRTPLSADATTDPGDDEYLVTEIAITAEHLAAGTITYTDTLDDGFLGVGLNTNSDLDGITKKNDRPPFARSIVQFRGYTFYLSCRREARLKIQLKTIDNLIDNTDKIVITRANGEKLEYFFSTAENVGARKFKRYTALSDVENVRETMFSFCKVLAQDGGNDWFYAYYDSGFDDPAGIVRIQARNLDEGLFTVGSNHGTEFTPDIAVAQEADNLDLPHRLYWSKFEQPEAVPEANMKDIGSADEELLTGFALTASLMLVKGDGVWRQTGNDEWAWELLPFDPSISFSCRDSAAYLDNQGYMVSEQGLVRISDAGVQIVSWPIELALKKIFSFENWKELSFGCSYHSDRRYIFWTPKDRGDTCCRVGWVYNHITERWTTWEKPVRFAYVFEAEDRLILAHAEDGYLLKERRSFETSENDYEDEGIPITITSVDTTTYRGRKVSRATFAYDYSGMALAPGFFLEQFTRAQSGPIVLVENLGEEIYRVTLDEFLPDLMPEAAEVALPILSIVRPKPEVCGNAAVSKVFSKLQIYMEDSSCLHADIGFSSDVAAGVSYYPIELNPEYGFGLGAFGERPWGDEDPSPAKVFKKEVPVQYMTCRALSPIFRHAWAREKFSILSWAMSFRQTGDVTTMEPR